MNILNNKKLILFKNNIKIFIKKYNSILHLYKNIKKIFIKKKQKYFKKIFYILKRDNQHKIEKCIQNKIKKNKIKNEVIKEVIKEEVIKEEVIKEEVIKEKVIKEEVIKEEVIKNEVIKEEVIKEVKYDNNIENRNDYTVKFCVFLGRKKNMEILHSYIDLALKEKIIDEYHMFDFSRNINDHNFIQFEYNRLLKIYSNKIYLHNFENNEIKLNKQNISYEKVNWSPFYKEISLKSNDKDIIIKCDDDILFIDIYKLQLLSLQLIVLLYIIISNGHDVIIIIYIICIY